MRYRKLDANADYSFGSGQGNFFIDQPEAVGQSIYTRLMLWTGQWFADLTQGTPWAAQVLGVNTRWTRDIVLQNVVQTTYGVKDIVAYASTVNVDTRSFTAAMTVDTVYGAVQVLAPSLPATIPPLPPPTVMGANRLGLIGGPRPETGTIMETADLTQPGMAAITEFQVTNADSGRY